MKCAVIVVCSTDWIEAGENEPTFAAFLTFLDEMAAKQPERLGDTIALTDRYLHLVDGVRIDADPGE